MHADKKSISLASELVEPVRAAVGSGKPLSSSLAEAATGGEVRAFRQRRV
jgi:hypothetical protein